MTRRATSRRSSVVSAMCAPSGHATLLCPNLFSLAFLCSPCDLQSSHGRYVSTPLENTSWLADRD